MIIRPRYSQRLTLLKSPRLSVDETRQPTNSESLTPISLDTCGRTGVNLSKKSLQRMLSHLYAVLKMSTPVERKPR